MPKIVTVDTSTSSLDTVPPTIQNNGTTKSSIVVRVINTEGNPMVGLDASYIVLTATGTGNTLTQPTGITNSDGEISGEISSTTAQTITVTATVLGVSLLESSTLIVNNITPAPEWEITRNFNSGPAGASVKGKADGMNNTTAVYDATHVFEGAFAAKTTIQEGKSGFGSWGGIVPFPTPLVRYDELWVRISLYVPSDFSIAAGPGFLKFLRIRSRNTAGSPNGHVDWLINNDSTQVPPTNQYRMIKEGQQIWFRFGETSLLTRDTWHTFTWNMTADSVPGASGGQGRVRAWQNGVLIQDENRVRTINAVDDVLTALYMFTHYNNDSPKTQSVWIDDVRIAANGTPSWAP
jgi:hypothetical protein